EKPDPEKYTLPLRLYAGNKDITPARYDDFAQKKVPQGPLTPAPALGTLDKAQENPAFEPPQKTWTERYPLLAYFVLGAASVVLLILLGALVKQAISRHDAEAKIQTT